MTTSVLSYAQLAQIDLGFPATGRDWSASHQHCAYCSSRLLPLPLDGAPRKKFRFIFSLHACESCGWWYLLEEADLCNDGYANAYSGILQAFDVSASAIPVEVLLTELPKRIEAFHDVNPKRMEDLVAAVLAGVYDCEVQQLGYSRDGGVDLLLLRGDQPVAVQVKRRASPRHNEGVEVVREFLGAALLGGYRQLMFVTTGSGYSSGAARAAAVAQQMGLVASFELLSRDALASLMHRNMVGPPWKAALQDGIAKYGNLDLIPDPYVASACGKPDVGGHTDEA